jgi:hypothetical protein
MRVSVALAPSCLGLTQTNLSKLRRTIKSKLLIRPSPSAEIWLASCTFTVLDLLRRFGDFFPGLGWGSVPILFKGMRGVNSLPNDFDHVGVKQRA